MIITTESGLAIARFVLHYQDKSILLKKVLLDTGCAVTVFDTDAVELAGLTPNRERAQLVCMTGIGGKSDYCIEQTTPLLGIDDYFLYQFQHQLGNIREPYGFDAILGNDFLTATGIIDWSQLIKPHWPEPPSKQVLIH